MIVTAQARHRSQIRWQGNEDVTSPKYRGRQSKFRYGERVKVVAGIKDLDYDNGHFQATRLTEWPQPAD
jgi:hypothetical protein